MSRDNNNINQVSYICSPMNYIGGKYKLLPQIEPKFPKDINIFFDMFCGGGNVGINASAKKVYFNDNLSYLIDLYRCFSKEETSFVIDHVNKRISEFGLSLTNTGGFNSLRALYNKERNPLDLFVLVAYSFNHQIRFNNDHQFNCPFGKDRSCYNPRIEANLINFVDRLHSIDHEFLSSNFDELDMGFLGKSDFVYCDPPYLITTGSYNDGKRGFTGWGKLEEAKLLKILKELDSRGVRFALSNVIDHKGRRNEMLADWVKENDFCVHYLAKDYRNSNYHTQNIGVTQEVLVTNYSCNEIHR